MLKDRIVKYVTACNCPVSLEKLLAKTQASGFSESEVLQALSGIGKRLKSTVRGDVVYYQVPPPPKAPTDHLAWLNANYPRYDYEMPFPEIDYSWMFLKTKEERDLFISEMKGRPMVYNKKRYEHQR